MRVGRDVGDWLTGFSVGFGVDGIGAKVGARVGGIFGVGVGDGVTGEAVGGGSATIVGLAVLVPGWPASVNGAFVGVLVSVVGAGVGKTTTIGAMLVGLEVGVPPPPPPFAKTLPLGDIVGVYM